jgi:hypothetical protein
VSKQKFSNLEDERGRKEKGSQRTSWENKLSLWQRRWRWQQLHYLQKRETHLRILRIAWNFFLASSNAASGSSIRHISIAAMDFPYLACHPHQSQKVAVVRQSNKRHELPAQSKERVTVYFFC